MSVCARFLLPVLGCLWAGGAQDAFANLPCASRLAIADGTHASSMGRSFSGTTVTILGQFIVDEDVLFQNCQVYMEQGAGINCYGPQGWHTLKQFGFGAGATALPSFADCHWGIYTQYMSVYSSESFMENVGTAYRIEKSGYGELELLDSTLSAAQREAIRAGIAGLKEAIGARVNWSAAIAEAASGAKAQAATGLQALTASVATSALIESNEKAVCGIYLATIGTDAPTFTPSEAASLFAIASQCPMLGGNAVFQARALYWLIDDAHDFDDASLCLPHGIVVKGVTPDRTSTVRIEPNPATDHAALIFSEPLPWDCALSVFNALGEGVIRILVPPETPRMAFDTSRLAPGIYSYSVASGTRAIGHGKLTIAR